MKRVSKNVNFKVDEKNELCFFLSWFLITKSLKNNNVKIQEICFSIFGMNGMKLNVIQIKYREHAIICYLRQSSARLIFADSFNNRFTLRGSVKFVISENQKS
jgi:hypothetical protein